jgi:hypothetical protein
MEPDSLHSPKKEKPRRRREWLILLLALLMSFGCVFCSSSLALRFWPDRMAPASLLAHGQANYWVDPDDKVRFAVLDPLVVAQAATDVAQLQLTPSGIQGDGFVKAVALPFTPTPTEKAGAPPALSAPTRSSTATPQPTLTPIKPTAIPSPTPIPPTLEPTPTTIGPATSTPQPTTTSTSTIVPPTSTLPPTNTPSPVRPTSTPIPIPTDTPTPIPTSPPDDGGGGDPPPPGNTPPVAANDLVTTDEDTAVNIAVLSNDSDPDGTLVPGTVTVVSNPANGTTLVDTTTGQISYNPSLNFNGTDVFAYQVCDNNAACATATVTVTVNPVNDPPVAVADSASTAEDTSEYILVRDNDSDVDGDLLTVVLTGTPSNGTATTDGDTVGYTPAANFNGTDVFTYTISDGSLTDTTVVTLTIIAVNDSPVAVADTYTTTQGITLTVSPPGVLSNDFDVDTGDVLTAVKVSDPISGTLTLNGDGSFTYVPIASFTGMDTFTYRAEDTIAAPSNVVTVAITVF